MKTLHYCLHCIQPEQHLWPKREGLKCLLTLTSVQTAVNKPESSIEWPPASDITPGFSLCFIFIIGNTSKSVSSMTYSSYRNTSFITFVWRHCFCSKHLFFFVKLKWRMVIFSDPYSGFNITSLLFVWFHCLLTTSCWFTRRSLPSLLSVNLHNPCGRREAAQPAQMVSEQRSERAHD